MFMKKIYSFLLLTLLCCFTQRAVADTHVKVDVDDASRVKVMVNNQEVQGMVTGMNDLTVPQYGSVQVEARAGNFLRKIMKTDTKGKASEQYISSMKTSSVYVNEGSDEGAVITITSGNLDAARTASCTIKTDKAAKIGFMRTGSYEQVPLQDGENTVKWMPGVEEPFLFSAASGNPVPLYKVLKDGQNVLGLEDRYTVKPTQGCVIEILAEYPDVDFPVVFNFSKEEAKEALKAVKVNDVVVTNYLDNNYAVKAGSKITLVFDQQNYSLDSLKHDGVRHNVYGEISFIITAATTFDIAAHKYGTIKANFRVDNPANITVYEGSSWSGKQIAVKAGLNALEVSETNSVIEVKPNSGCKIESLTVNGTTMSPNYSGAYQITLKEGMEIEVTTSAIVRDQKATVYIDDITVANYTFYLQRADRSNVEVKTGENEIQFSTADNPFMLGVYGSDLSKMVVKQNGKVVDATYKGNAALQLNIKNGDRIEILLKGVVSGIADTLNAPQQQTIYTLDGRHVSAPSRGGLYIINGKKTILK